MARVEDAEAAAAEVWARWGLGLEPLASVTATLENHFVHVLEIDDDDRFD